MKRFEKIESVKNRTIPGKTLSAAIEKKTLDVAQFVEDYSSIKQLSNMIQIKCLCREF